MESHFETSGVGSSEVSWPLKARRPVLNLGPFYGGLFSPLAFSRCTSASPLVTRQNSPGIWTLRCQPETTIHNLQYAPLSRFSFQPLPT